MLRLIRVAACVGAVSLAGCATIVAGGPDVVLVSSKPDGATVTLDGYPVGHTPCQVSVKRDSEGVFGFELPGYQKTLVDRDKVLNGWFLGNLLIGGPIGIGVDLITHDQGKYSTDPLFVELTPASGGQPAPVSSGQQTPAAPGQ
jgi:hypothetical protein